MKRNTILKDAFVLFIITLIAGLCLGYVNEITQDKIASAKEKSKQEAYEKVFEDAVEFSLNDELTRTAVTESEKWLTDAGYNKAVVIEEALLAKNEKGELLGYVFSITGKEGYGGDINISLGVFTDGTISGIEILTMSETAGLGAKCTEDSFKNQFAGKNADALEVVKSSTGSASDINAISGATITSKAVTKAVNAGIYFVNNVSETAQKEESKQEG